MPYSSTGRLPRERANKLGHLEVLKSDLVNDLIESFESPSEDEVSLDEHGGYEFHKVEDIIGDAEPLNIVFGIDGSLQTIRGSTNQRKEMSFIKTAMLRLDKYALSKVDRQSPHPKELRDILDNSAVYHATVIPLRNVHPRNMNLYDGVRKVIHDSLADKSLDEEIMKTLQWLVFEEWDGRGRPVSENFDCPHCRKVKASIRQGDDSGECASCGEKVRLSDYLGFHVEMDEEFASGTVPSSYMLVHETLLMLTAAKHYWEQDRERLQDILFVKDGGLYIRAHYSKLVAPIRRFLQYAYDQGTPIYMIGQEKTGHFVDYLENLAKGLSPGSVVIPGDSYIKQFISTKPSRGGPYGRTSNYGSKIFVHLATHNFVLSVPTGNYTADPKLEDLIGLPRILATLPEILSFRYENGLLPIELANGIASLSTYPSARILQLFAES